MAQVIVVVAALAWVVSAITVGQASPDAVPPGAATAGATDVGGGPHLDAAKIEGMALCVDCHRAEVTHWMANWKESEHGWVGYSRLRGERAEELAEDLEIDVSQLTKDSVCIECHATPNLDFHGRKKPVLGVACEACHGESGGTQGWLNMHAVYGPPGTNRYGETIEHFGNRKARSAAAGQLKSDDIYSMVRRCFHCHIVGDERLINETDHQIEDRDFTDFVGLITSEKIRHNFHLDQEENAEVSSLWLDPHWHPQRAADREKSIEAREKMYYVASVFARAEVVVRLLSQATDPLGDYAGDLASLLDVGDLEDVLESVDLSDADRDDAEELVEAIEDLELEDTAGDTDEDETLSLEEIGELNRIADWIESIGKKLTSGDGDQLEEVELP